jgi:DNA processing protein
VSGPGVQPSPTLEALVALSLLRLGTDTVVARLFKELTQSVDPGLNLPEITACILDVFGPGSGQRFEDALVRARGALTDARARSIDVVTVLDPCYPARLRAIPDPPLVLWTVAPAESFTVPAVAVVGSRRATPTGLGVSRRLSRDLAAAGVLVISGLARGIDGAAHRGALDAAGQTVAVLGNGPDVVYPREHRELMQAVQRSGGVLSEFPPGTRPERRHFPLRNRIISGLSQAVVVVEASEKSGSLITARAALDQGRDVLAVPGSVASGTYRGCHALIKDGARLVETVDDILEEIGRPRTARGQEPQAGKCLSVSSLGRFIQAEEPLSVDELAARSGRPAADCLADLTLLEISGHVARTTGGGFVRLDGPARYIGAQVPPKREGSVLNGEGSGRRRIAGEGEDD